MSAITVITSKQLYKCLKCPFAPFTSYCYLINFHTTHLCSNNFTKRISSLKIPTCGSRGSRKSSGRLCPLVVNLHSSHITGLEVTTRWQANKDTLLTPRKQRKRKGGRGKWSKEGVQGWREEREMSTCCIINSLVFSKASFLLFSLCCHLSSSLFISQPFFSY